MNLQRLEARVRQARIFSALGSDIDGFRGARIHSWGDWPGPEEPTVEHIGTRLQCLHDKLIAKSDDDEWDKALSVVIEAVAPNVPYEESQDAWYGPNAAAWFAAWVFCLEEAYLFHGLPLPAELVAQLTWFERGHWPCALIEVSRGENAEDYVIY